MFMFYLALTCTQCGGCNSAQGQSREASLWAWQWLQCWGPWSPKETMGVHSCALTSAPAPSHQPWKSGAAPCDCLDSGQMQSLPEGQAFTYPGHMTPLGIHAGK